MIIHPTIIPKDFLPIQLDVALFLFAAIKWGDWRKWRNYYPTILFFMVGDLY
jgi:hypothetical protein